MVFLWYDTLLRPWVKDTERAIPKFYKSALWVEVGVRSKHVQNLYTEKLMKIELYEMIDSLKVLHGFGG